MRPPAVGEETRKQVAAQLEQAYRQWCGLPVLQHAAIVVALALVVLVSSWGELTYPEPSRDEGAYAAAFEAVRDGRDPYQGTSYLYPPILAWAGGWITSRHGVMTALVLVRLINVLGVVTCSWLAVIWFPLALRWRILASAGILVGSPSVQLGLECSNLSLAISGLMAVALIFWRERPRIAGSLLGISVAIKPVAVLAIGVLGAHDPQPPSRRQWTAAAVGVLVTGSALLAAPGLWQFLEVGGQGLEHRTASIHRLAYLVLGAGWSLWVTAGVAIVALLVARRLRSLGRMQAMAVATAATLTATPLVWGHTHVASLPLQGAALAVLWLRLSRRFPFEVVGVTLAILASQTAQGVTGVYSESPWLQAVGVLPPSAAPILLAGYLVWAADPV